MHTYINVEELGLSQMYLNHEKLQRLRAWYDPHKMDEYEPLPAISKIPVVIDQDEIVTCALGNRLYQEYIGWCNRLGINTVKDLEHRIISADAYEFLWLERCNRLFHLMKAVEDRVLPYEAYEARKQLGKNKQLLLYGADEELRSFYYEDLRGNLYLYKDGQFTKEHHEYSWGRST